MLGQVLLPTSCLVQPDAVVQAMYTVPWETVATLLDADAGWEAPCAAGLFALAQQCCLLDPAQRPSFAAVVAVLQQLAGVDGGAQAQAQAQVHAQVLPGVESIEQQAQQVQQQEQQQQQQQSEELQLQQHQQDEQQQAVLWALHLGSSRGPTSSSSRHHWCWRTWQRRRMQPTCCCSSWGGRRQQHARRWVATADAAAAGCALPGCAVKAALHTVTLFVVLNALV